MICVGIALGTQVAVVVAMGRRAWIGWLALVLGSSACLGSQQEEKKQGNRLAACANGASEAEIQDNIYVTEEYAVALANSLTIGWLPNLFAIDFLLQLDEALRDASNGQLPQWIHHNGVYRHQGMYAGVDLRVSTTTDSGYGPAGTPVVEDLLKLDSYFLGATATRDCGITSTVVVGAGLDRAARVAPSVL